VAIILSLSSVFETNGPRLGAVLSSEAGFEMNAGTSGSGITLRDVIAALELSGFLFSTSVSLSASVLMMLE